jgi:hypothetical protein
MACFKTKIFILTAVFNLAFAPLALANDASSTNFTVQDPVITSGFQNASSANFNLGQSLSQIAIGKSTSTSFQLLSGFQYFFKADANTLTATAGNGQVSLSWTVPQTYLGGVINNYELGVGTSSGSYTYSNVGSVTSYTQTGLTNGTNYYFKVRAKTAGGITLTYSNEASAAPSGSATPTGGSGGGGGGGGYVAVVNFSGFTSPNSKVVVLKNSIIEAETTSNTSGAFSVSLQNQPSGAINYSLYAIDPAGARSGYLNTQINVPATGSAQSQNLLLPPTLSSDKAEVKKGDDISFFGYTLPSASVGLEALGKSADEFTINSNLEGYYKFTVNTKNAVLGKYSAKSKALLQSAATPFSSPVYFLVGTENVEAQKPGQCPARADFNNDCKVNLIDFSIQAYWYLKPNPDPKVDLNSDGVVDLVDFSILAYYWTG